MRSVCLSVALVVLTGGCAGQPAVHGSAGAPGSFRLEILSGASEEWCFEARSGDLIVYRFEADAQLVFNLHYHDGDAIRYPVPAHPSAAEKGQLRVPSSNGYCVMWTNEGDAAVNLTADILVDP